MEPSSRLAAIAFMLCLASAETRAAPVVPPDFVAETRVSALDEPNSLAFLPDGRCLITERTSGKVRLLVGDHVASSDPLVVVPDLNSENLEMGLQGIAVDPRWPAHPYVYVCYTRRTQAYFIRLIRYTASGDLTSPTSETLALGSPHLLRDDIPIRTGAHNGLGLRFGLDGHLLMSLGEDVIRCDAQELSTGRGCLLRMDVTRVPPGAGGPAAYAALAPPGNPFTGPDSVTALIYAHGLRNPWRFHVDPTTGSILLADVGESAYEELNEVFAGNNFGWPFREGPLVQVPEECAEPGGPGASVYDPPILAVHQSTGTGFRAISTAGVYRPVPGAPSNWPALYWGTLFYGDFFHSQLRRLVRSGTSWIAPPAIPGQAGPDDWASQIYFATDWLVGPDGSLYWLQMWNDAQQPATGMLRRIRYTGSPVAVEPSDVAGPGLAIAPNPFRDHAVVTWARGGSSVRLVIHDLAGRVVRRAETSGAEGRWVWDGRDDRGRPVLPGLYLVRSSTARDPVRIVKVR